MTWTSKVGGMGMSVRYFGGSLYQEIRAGLSYGRRFGKQFSAGIRIDYYRIQGEAPYGNSNLGSFEAGLLYMPNPDWAFGIRCLNPVPVKIAGHPSGTLPWEVMAGAGFHAGEKIFITAELGKQDGIPVTFRGGVEYRAKKMLALRLGVSGGPLRISFGAGLSWKRFHIDIASGYHIQLGANPSVSFTYGL